MIRLYTGNILNSQMEKDFRSECPYRHKCLYSQTLRKKSVKEAACGVYFVTMEQLESVNKEAYLTCGDFDYALLAELKEVPNRNDDGSRAALRYSDPFCKQPSSTRRRFFDFAIKMSVERDIDISFISNSTEFFDSIIHALETNKIQKGGVEVKVYSMDGCRVYNSDEILEINRFGLFDIIH